MNTKIDYEGPEFSNGYEDGYLGRQPRTKAEGSYREGYITGLAEQDAPREMVQEHLFLERQRILRGGKKP